MTKNKVVKVGIGVIIKNGRNQILLGKRKNSHGSTCWAPPGGHLEFGETFFECAQRETAEETGMKVYDMKVVATTNDIFQKEEKHYISVFVEGKSDDIPQVLEPEKCESWNWFEVNNLPEPLFLSFESYITIIRMKEKNEQK